MQKILKAIFIFIAIALIPFSIFILYKVSLFFINATDEIKATLISVTGVTIAAYVGHWLAQRREIKSRHYTDKVKAYKNILTTLLKILNNSSDSNYMNKHINEFKEIQKELLIWADSGVVDAWTCLLGKAVNIEANARKDIYAWEELIKAMRKDLGHNDIAMKKGALLKIILKPDEYHKI